MAYSVRRRIDRRTILGKGGLAEKMKKGRDFDGQRFNLKEPELPPVLRE